MLCWYKYINHVWAWLWVEQWVWPSGSDWISLIASTSLYLRLASFPGQPMAAPTQVATTLLVCATGIDSLVRTSQVLLLPCGSFSRLGMNPQVLFLS